MNDIQGPAPDDPTTRAGNDATTAPVPGGSARRGVAPRGPSRRRVVLPVIVLLAVVALAAALAGAAC